MFSMRRQLTSGMTLVLLLLTLGMLCPTCIIAATAQQLRANDVRILQYGHSPNNTTYSNILIPKYHNNVVSKNSQINPSISYVSTVKENLKLDRARRKKERRRKKKEQRKAQRLLKKNRQKLRKKSRRNRKKPKERAGRKRARNERLLTKRGHSSYPSKNLVSNHGRRYSNFIHTPHSFVTEMHNRHRLFANNMKRQIEDNMKRTRGAWLLNSNQNSWHPKTTTLNRSYPRRFSGSNLFKTLSVTNNLADTKIQTRGRKPESSSGVSVEKPQRDVRSRSQNPTMTESTNLKPNFRGNKESHFGIPGIGHTKNSRRKWDRPLNHQRKIVTKQPHINDVIVGKISKNDVQKDWEWFIPKDIEKNLKGTEVEEGFYGKEDKPVVVDDGDKVDGRRRDGGTCLKCPPKRRVSAPRGQDCVPFLVPSAVDKCPTSTSHFHELHTLVASGGLQPGSLLKEGHYDIRLYVMENTSKKPIKRCTLELDVKVHRCSPLAKLANGSTKCSAESAWGSRCRFGCGRGFELVGVDDISCVGHKRTPRWSNEFPVCRRKGCSIPKSIIGSSQSCALPQNTQKYSRYHSANLVTYPVGTVCRISCTKERTLRLTSKVNGRMTLLVGGNSVTSKCMSQGLWSDDIDRFTCIIKSSVPQPLIGECRNLTVELDTSGKAVLFPPKFKSLSGQIAPSSCDFDTVRSTGTSCRSCRSKDTFTAAEGECVQCITATRRKPEVKQGCPALRPPIHGRLTCRRSFLSGQMECQVECQKGFLLLEEVPPNGIVCLNGGPMWSFQASREQTLPPCVLRR